jgi:HD-GYP domain-containing protein (c-di-GMP phosphodiesterase class II)
LEKELEFKKKVLFRLYTAVLLATSFYLLFSFLYIREVFEMWMVLLTMAATVLALLSVRINRMQTANHLLVSVFTFTVFLNLFINPELPYSIFVLLIPIILTALLERNLVFILFGVMILSGILIFAYVNYVRIEFLAVMLVVFITTILILYFFNLYRIHLESVRFHLLNQTIESAIFILGYTTELRDQETKLHLDRVSIVAELLARALAKMPEYSNYLGEQYFYDIRLATTLHDVGKVVIPDSILLKPGKLDLEEFEIIKTHASKGAEIIDMARSRLEDRSVFHMAHDIALSHHERWDGKGYPLGIKEEEISLSAQIVAVCDVYDALASERPYKKAFPHEKCVQIILEGRATQFSPRVVDAFMNIEGKIATLYASGEELRIAS